jgi:peptidoglycan hydrolase-like protein with peptidoglycan-binding domain
MQLSGHLGAVSSPAVVRLQSALNALGQQKHDAKLLVQIDGVVGPATAEATNRALGVYVAQGAGRIPSTWQRATTRMITASANDIAAYIERAAAPLPTATPPPQPGGYPMPYYPQPSYYPPPVPYGYGYGGGGPTFAPGGLPIDHASLDVKAFIPAQYDHIQLDPETGLAILAAGLGVVLLVTHHKNKHHHHKP